MNLLKRANWKRLSKKGTGDNIIRRFENKATGLIMLVKSSEDMIYSVEEGLQPITNIKEHIRTLLNQGYGYYDLQYQLFNDVDNWPIITLPDPYEEDNIEEPLDMENFEWLSLTDNEIQIACGGDWQEPYTLVIQLINGRLTVVQTTPGYPEGMSEEEFHKNLA